jgi:hypothetical protein
VDDFLPQTTRSAESEHGHEANTLSVRTLVMFATAVVALAIIVNLILASVMEGVSKESRTAHALEAPRFKDEEGAFPSPRLQADPAGSFAAFKRGELERLNGYGWVDQKKGVAHIPIDRAIEILAERGLPKGSARGKGLTPAEAAAIIGPPAGEPPRPAAAGERKP